MEITIKLTEEQEKIIQAIVEVTETSREAVMLTIIEQAFEMRVWEY